MVRTRQRTTGNNSQLILSPSSSSSFVLLRRILPRHHKSVTTTNCNTMTLMGIQQQLLSKIRSPSCLFVLLFILLLIVFASNHNSREYIDTSSTTTITATTTTIKKEDVASSKKETMLIELPADLDGCIVGPTVTIEANDTSSTSKPFWVPSYPASDNSLLATLIVQLTGGQSSNAKNYYASSPTLRKCFNRNGASSVTITCHQIHPVVSIGPSPEQQVHKFQNTILMPIRNILSCAPEHYQQKAAMYHDAKDQVPIDEWRSYRDEWMTKTIVSGWKSVITTWKDMNVYSGGIGLYIPLEHILDVERGPILIQKMANILRKAGFPVVGTDTDVKCVWYNVVKQSIQSANKECIQRNYTIAAEEILQYSYGTKYIPRYTKEQKIYMINEMNSIIQMYPNDTQLVAILQEYIQQIQSETIDDS